MCAINNRGLEGMGGFAIICVLEWTNAEWCQCVVGKASYVSGIQQKPEAMNVKW